MSKSPTASDHHYHWQKDDSDGIGQPGVRKPGLYAILFNDRIVYIGQSRSIQWRLTEHTYTYQRLFGSTFKRGTRVRHFLHGVYIGSTRFPDLCPLRFKYCVMPSSNRRDRETREMRLIRRVKPLINKAGAK